MAPADGSKMTMLGREEEVWFKPMVAFWDTRYNVWNVELTAWAYRPDLLFSFAPAMKLATYRWLFSVPQFATMCAKDRDDFADHSLQYVGSAIAGRMLRVSLHIPKQNAATAPVARSLQLIRIGSKESKHSLLEKQKPSLDAFHMATMNMGETDAKGQCRIRVGLALPVGHRTPLQVKLLLPRLDHREIIGTIHFEPHEPQSFLEPLTICAKPFTSFSSALTHRGLTQSATYASNVTCLSRDSTRASMRTISTLELPPELQSPDAAALPFRPNQLKRSMSFPSYPARSGTVRSASPRMSSFPVYSRGTARARLTINTMRLLVTHEEKSSLEKEEWRVLEKVCHAKNSQGLTTNTDDSNTDDTLACQNQVGPHPPALLSSSRSTLQVIDVDEARWIISNQNKRTRATLERCLIAPKKFNLKGPSQPDEGPDALKSSEDLRLKASIANWDEEKRIWQVTVLVQAYRNPVAGKTRETDWKKMALHRFRTAEQAPDLSLPPSLAEERAKDRLCALGDPLSNRTICVALLYTPAGSTQQTRFEMRLGETNEQGKISRTLGLFLPEDQTTAVRVQILLPGKRKRLIFTTIHFEPARPELLLPDSHSQPGPPASKTRDPSPCTSPE
eukprot:g72517.t1